MKKIISIIFLFCFLFLFFNVFLVKQVNGQTGLFPGFPQFSLGADYGTLFKEEEDEEWEEYVYTKVYAKISQEIYNGIFYIAEGYYSNYNYESNPSLDKNIMALYNYIKIKTFPSMIINIIFGYKNVDYLSTHPDYSFFKVGANLKYRFAKYSYFYISYAFYNRQASTDYSLHHIYISLNLPIWLFDFSIYAFFDYKIFTDLSNSFKYMVGFDFTFDLNYLVKE